jgi:hypothetical protein
MMRTAKKLLGLFIFYGLSVISIPFILLFLLVNISRFWAEEFLTTTCGWVDESLQRNIW